MSPPSLFDPLELPCGTVLRNRIVKSAMSDSLGDGQGNPTEEQMRLYQRWAEGGVAAPGGGMERYRCWPGTAPKPSAIPSIALSDDDGDSGMASRPGVAVAIWARELPEDGS